MNIYLARHGDAIYQHPDDLSPLSTKGEKDIDTLAKFLLPLQLEVTIFHSGKLRAQQTAERLAAGVILNGAITTHEGLNPTDPVLPIANELNEGISDVMLVGHMPFMGRLVGQLINKNANQDVVAFHKGTLLCLQYTGNAEWVIDWVLHPGIIPLQKNV